MRAFEVIDWQEDFIARLADELVAAGDAGDSLVVFPHRRPARYLMRELAGHPELKKPFFPPEVLSVNDLMTRLRQGLDLPPARNASILDRAALLQKIVDDSLRTTRGPLSALPEDREVFFAWGLRLAGLMDEFFRQAVRPSAAPYAEEDVLQPAADLLANLDVLYDDYRTGLTERGWTTPGLDALLAAEKAEEAAGLLAGRRVFLAGFHVLTGSEEALFKALWRNGARILLHADPALAGGAGHWSCRELGLWAKSWGARLENGSSTTDKRSEPALRVVEAFDLHSQLKALAESLSRKQGGNTAVVLPDSGALTPVLHHLPGDLDVNVSMGYPLSRSPLYRLLETVMRLQETSREKGRYYWRDLIQLVRHPYLKMLRLESGAPLGRALGAYEQDARTGDKYQDPKAWEPDPESLPPGLEAGEARDALTGLAEAALSPFEDVGTFGGLGRALLAFSAYIFPESEDSPWPRSPLDAECLYRLTKSVIPELTGCESAEIPLSQAVLFSTLRRLLEAERAPFEAEPLTGLQVLGWLETRLLAFDSVHVLDASDELLPGSAESDPLLPDPLRGKLGLPDWRERDQVAAYNFYRLAAGCGELTVYYPAGEGGRDKLGGRGVRSRFAEQLIWEQEKRAGRLARTGKFLVEQVDLPPGPLPGARPGIPKSGAVLDRLEHLLRKVSSSLLDAYLRCPVRFYYERVARLAPPEEISEEGDPMELGSIVHEALKRFLAPFEGRAVTREHLDENLLVHEYQKQLRAAPFYARMPLDMRLAARHAGPRILLRFVQDFPDTYIVGLEREYTRGIDTGFGVFDFTGRVDRIDERGLGEIILDYKTGSVPACRKNFWRNEALFERLAGWSPGLDPDFAAEVAEAMPSVQLPLYMLLYREETGREPMDAAWVDLRNGCREKNALPAREAEAEREAMLGGRFQALAGFLLRHMLEEPRFEPRPGRHCDFCPYRGGCPR